MLLLLLLFFFNVKFSEKKVFYDSLVLTLNNSFSLQLLQAWYLYVFSHSPWFSPKLNYSSTWKNVFQNHVLLYFWALYSYQYMILAKLCDSFCTLFSTNPFFDAYFKFIMCVTCSFVSCKFAISFSTFSNFILSGRKGKLWKLHKFSRFYTSTWRKYPFPPSSF